MSNSSDSGHDTGRIVSAFCNAWGERDIDTIAGSLADDAVYHNIPMAPVEGKEAIVATISGFFEGMEIEFETTKQVVDGNIVMNERIDTLVDTDDGSRTVLPVMGVFELNDDGKITAWRDYFDLKTLMGER